jgi:hypothetical protein
MKQICGIIFLVILSSCKKEETNPPDPIVITPVQPQEPKVYAFETTPAWSDEFDVNGLPNNQIWGYDVGGGGWGMACHVFTSQRERLTRRRSSPLRSRVRPR